MNKKKETKTNTGNKLVVDRGETGGEMNNMDKE